MTTADMSTWATWSEIHSQPAIWRQWASAHDFAASKAWIASQNFDEVWFCGAGTSAFIGDIIVAGLAGQAGPLLRSVPTTDLVAQPQALLRGRNPLVVSFGRSGNSSESIGTLDALDALAPDAPRLNITCNGESTLATRLTANSHVIVLPDATHDAGFAMTSSFSTMLLTALMLFADGQDDTSGLTQAADAFEQVLGAMTNSIGTPPKRAVFLGSGAMTFAAREAALKVMELSAGQIACLWDSVLGFRHGPKSFVTEGTEVVVFITDEDPTRQFETDLVAELRAQFPDIKVTTIGPGGDIELPHPNGAVWAAPNAVLYSQLAGALWSQAMGFNVDNPFQGQGTLTRVVSGVTLYPVKP